MSFRLLRSFGCNVSSSARKLSLYSRSAVAPSLPTAGDIKKYGLPILSKVSQHAKNGRILSLDWKHENGYRDVITYHQIMEQSNKVGKVLQNRSLAETGMIANLCVPGWEYISTLFAVWGTGSASVPLALTQTAPEIEHVLQDTQPDMIVLGGNCSYEGRPPTRCPPNEIALLKAAENVGLRDRVVRLKDILENESHTTEENDLLGYDVNFNDPALVLYTSGTTGKPKGVISTHKNIFFQATDLVSSWEWVSDDVALHVLPLHHVHGIINLLTCAAYSGAKLDFQQFDAVKLWEQWAESGNLNNTQPSVFMAVPTIYAKLIEASQSLPPQLIDAAVENTLRPMRLMVSGSAALPVSVLERWQRLTGHTLLERYGMTEFAMALSNPYRPESQRHAGHVGRPLPSVEVKIIDEDSGKLVSNGSPGNLFVKGHNVFQEYLNRPEATRAAFDKEGFFDTGDVAEFNQELNSYRILGRSSVDIIKVGGHKVSALEIERVLLEHPQIQEVAILGLPDETWGDRVAMIARLKGESETITVDDLREWCETRMSKYKVPSRLLLVEDIPKNAMGKVNKKDLKKLFQ